MVPIAREAATTASRKWATEKGDRQRASPVTFYSESANLAQVQTVVEDA